MKPGRGREEPLVELGTFSFLSWRLGPWSLLTIWSLCLFVHLKYFQIKFLFFTKNVLYYDLGNKMETPQHTGHPTLPCSVQFLISSTRYLIAGTKPPEFIEQDNEGAAALGHGCREGAVGQDPLALEPGQTGS